MLLSSSMLPILPTAALKPRARRLRNLKEVPHPPPLIMGARHAGHALPKATLLSIAGQRNMV
jgi:hypothetical protein